MPKEIIKYPTETVFNNPLFNEDGGHTSKVPGLTVGWTRNAANEMGVQLFINHDMGDEPDVVQVVNLDREVINRLVRTLRKARDAAYGADA